MGRAANRSRTPRTGTTELCVLASWLERIRPRRPWNARLARLDTAPMSPSLDATTRKAGSPKFAPNIVTPGYREADVCARHRGPCAGDQSGCFRTAPSRWSPPPKTTTLLVITGTNRSSHVVRRINDSPHREGGLPGRAIEVQCRVLQEGGGSRPDYRLVGILSTPRANTHFKGFWDIGESLHFRSG